MNAEQIQEFEQLVIQGFVCREETAQVTCGENNHSATTHLLFAVTTCNRNRIEKLARKYAKVPGISIQNSGFPTKKYFLFDLAECEKTYTNFKNK